MTYKKFVQPNLGILHCSEQSGPRCDGEDSVFLFQKRLDRRRTVDWHVLLDELADSPIIDVIAVNMRNEHGIQLLNAHSQISKLPRDVRRRKAAIDQNRAVAVPHERGITSARTAEDACRKRVIHTCIIQDIANQCFILCVIRYK